MHSTSYNSVKYLADMREYIYVDCLIMFWK